MKNFKELSYLVATSAFIIVCFGLIITSAKNISDDSAARAIAQQNISHVSSTSATSTTAASASDISEPSKCMDSNGVNISTDLDKISAEISKKNSCYSAAQLATNCAWGSSGDNQTVSAASDICQSEFEKNKPSTELKSLLKKMQSMCTAKYSKMDGTMYVSANDFCYLNALEWVNELATTDFSN